MLRGLRSYAEFREEFDLQRYITLSTLRLSALPEEMGKTIADADILIYNPVGPKYGFASSDSMLKLTKSGCLKICVPYYRFHGFWDRSDQARLIALKRVNGIGIFVHGSCLGTEGTYPVNWALNTGERRERAIAVFNECLNSFKDIDEQSSEVSLYEFFMDTYREAPLFPNYLHPSQEFMDEVVTQVATVAGFSGRARTVRALDRYSWPVQPAVAQALGLKRTPAPKILDEDFTLEQYLHISETLARLTEPVGNADALSVYIKEKMV